MNNNMDDGELYFVDSVKYFAPEIFVARLLKQREYSYLADELNIAISPRQVNKNLISYYIEKKKLSIRHDQCSDNGLYDGAFVRIKRKDIKKIYSKKDFRDNTLKYFIDLREVNLTCEYAYENKLPPELKKQKYKKIKEDYTSFDLLSLPQNSNHQKPKLYCFDVGQGDLSLFISSEGHAFIVDTHITQKHKKNTLTELKKLLDRRPIEALILTHRHYDHYCGAYLLLKDNDLKINSVIINQSFLEPSRPNQVDKLLQLAEKKSKIISLLHFLLIKDGATRLFFSFHHGNIDENDNSTLLQIYYQNKLYYLTGDMGYETLEKERLEDFYTQIVLKVSHHGSKTGTSEKFLRKLVYSPCIYNNSAVFSRNAFISYGINNRYGHPHDECIELLNKEGFKIIFPNKNYITF